MIMPKKCARCLIQVPAPITKQGDARFLQEPIKVTSALNNHRQPTAGARYVNSDDSTSTL